MKLFSHYRKRAFTLIELLIVVAIIAILAAIAVPNFLEAQTRSKVSRCAADMRSIRTAIESYYVDVNWYPETDTGTADWTKAGVGLIRCTTPVAYITTIPKSPFREEKIGHPSGSPKNCNKYNIYLYVRELKVGAGGKNIVTENDPNYVLDRKVYLFANAPLDPMDIRPYEGYWELKSVGPDNSDDRDSQQGHVPEEARIYDPTNGTVSAGDIVVYGDTQGFAHQKE